MHGLKKKTIELCVASFGSFVCAFRTFDGGALDHKIHRKSQRGKKRKGKE